MIGSSISVVSAIELASKSGRYGCSGGSSAAFFSGTLSLGL